MGLAFKRAASANYSAVLSPDLATVESDRPFIFNAGKFFGCVKGIGGGNVASDEDERELSYFIPLDAFKTYSSAISSAVFPFP